MAFIDVTVDYGTHEYTNTWEYGGDLYCPMCGGKGVWVARDGDYYVGSQHLCLACCHGFYLPDSPYPATDKYDLQRVRQLRES